jgi:hypothetical protein
MSEAVIKYEYTNQCFTRAALPDLLPRLHNYEEARKYHDSVVPFIKGKNKGMRPLGHNRKYNRCIISIGAQEAVNIKLYDTVVVSYKPDGSIDFNTGHWDTLTTSQVMQEVAGVTNIMRRRGKIYLINKGKAYHIGPTLSLSADGTVTGMPQQFKYALDKKAFSECMLHYKPFTDYVRQIISITKGVHISLDEFKTYSDQCGHDAKPHGPFNLGLGMRAYAYARLQTNKSREVLFAHLDKCLAIQDEESRVQAMYPAALMFAWCTDVGESAKNVEINFGKQVKAHFARKVFVKTPMPEGRIAPTTNLEYIWLTYGHEETT